MTLILLIDDDESLHGLLGQYLDQQGYSMLHASDGREGLEVFSERHPDIVILDVMMPHLNGWETLEQLRELSDVPVIVLTARTSEHDKLHGFRLGTDDYVTKPFSFAELSARIEAVLKRTVNQKQSSGVLQAGDIRLDPIRHLVTRAGTLVPLTPTEFKLLEVLMSEPGRVFTPEQLVIQVWGEEYMEEVGYIRRYIWHLRRKLEPNADNPQYIHNERGIGYKLRT